MTKNQILQFNELKHGDIFEHDLEEMEVIEIVDSRSLWNIVIVKNLKTGRKEKLYCGMRSSFDILNR